MRAHLIIFAIAYGCGLAAFWGVASLTAAEFLITARNFEFVMGLVFPPLAGVSVFALIFGLMSRRAMGLRFWVGAIVTAALAYGLGFGMIYQGITTPLEVLVLVLILLFIVGAIALRPRDRAQ